MHRLQGWDLITFTGRFSTGGKWIFIREQHKYEFYHGGKREDDSGESGDEVRLLFQCFPSPVIPIFFKGWKDGRSPTLAARGFMERGFDSLA